MSRGDVEDNVYYPKTLPNTPKEIRIDNNYILDPQIEGETDRRYSVIEPIYNQVNGFSFVSFDIKTQEVENKLSIELGDKISYIDIWGNNLTSYVMTKKISYLGGEPTNADNYEITLSAEEIKETSTEYSYASSVEDRLNRVEITTDKQNKKISAVVETQNEQSSQLSQVTQTVNDYDISIKNVQKSLETANGTIETLEGKITDMNFNFSTKGMAIGTTTDPNNSLYDNKGIRVYNYTKLNAIFNNKGSGIDKLIVTGTAQIGYLKFVKSTKNNKKVTKIFHLKELIEDLEDLEV